MTGAGGDRIKRSPAVSPRQSEEQKHASSEFARRSDSLRASPSHSRFPPASPGRHAGSVAHQKALAGRRWRGPAGTVAYHADLRQTPARWGRRRGAHGNRAGEYHVQRRRQHRRLVLHAEQQRGSTCTLSVGNVAAGDGNHTATFAATVSNPLPGGVSQIVNTATVTDNGASAPIPHRATTRRSDTTPVTRRLPICRSPRATAESRWRRWQRCLHTDYPISATAARRAWC